MFLRFTIVAACLLLPSLQLAAVEFEKLPGIVLDDSQAELVGSWKNSTSTKPYLGAGYIHDNNEAKGEKSVRFTFEVPKPGKYSVLLGYTPGTNREKKTQVEITTADGVKNVLVDETKKPELEGVFHLLGEFSFEKQGVVEIHNRNTTAHVIVDGLQILNAAELKLASKTPAPKPKPAKPAEKPKPKPPVFVEFQRQPAQREVAKLTVKKLDELLAEKIVGINAAPTTTDEQFLRRLSLDVTGRHPTVEALEAFVADESPDKRSKKIDELLASTRFGENWANYWSDAIGSRQMEPQLTFHNYNPFKKWLAEQINADKGWDETAFRMLTANGKVGQRPEATFIGFHQGNANRLAGEVSRVMLSVKIACAECHDHPFVDMPQETFHGMAAFFVRTEAKVAQFNSDDIEIVSKTKGEQKVPGKKNIDPVWIDGESVGSGLDDIDRRTRLAYWTTSGDNPWFARSHVNRVWSRLIGRGFAEPVDDLGEEADIVLPEIFNAVADHFVATDFSDRELFRLILNTKAYERALSTSKGDPSEFATVATKPLRGDEVFDSLVRAIQLENFTPERQKKTQDVRFPPPPKSTRDLVNQAFGYDPSFPDRLILRTMKQAMFLMNNPQIQEAIAAGAKDETFLGKLLANEPDNDRAITLVYQHVLAREPSDREHEIVSAHVAKIEDRTEAFEDLLWSLINSAEFTTKR